MPQTEAERSITQYLKAVLRFTKGRGLPQGFVYYGTADLLLKEGRFFTPQPLPAQWAGQCDTPRQCFDNAFRLAARSKGQLRYIEGIADSIIPVEHAWCVDANDRVVDPTWTNGRSYLGLEVPGDVLKASRRAGSLTALFDWMRKYPMCQVPYKR